MKSILNFKNCEMYKYKWNARQYAGNDPRIEIRKLVQGFNPASKGSYWFKENSEKINCTAELLAVIRKDMSIILSANGKMAFDYNCWLELNVAIEEAMSILNEN